MAVLAHAPGIVTERLLIRTESAPQFIDLTDRVQKIVDESGIQCGQVVVFSKHTTAAIRINEAEPELLLDFIGFLERVAPESTIYRHNDFTVRTVNMTDDECANAHAHCRQLLLSTSETIPVVDAELCLGTWQRIFLVELDHPRERSVIVQVTGQ
ncbi:MAG TPA: secondary thiamine-phosphate synthase enzyme YjbQ [Chloroflexota bacterium]|nr:secondary thiamine-phosphate synthase enzyme YjbQ [Chloroflexota bacterium]